MINGKERKKADTSENEYEVIIDNGDLKLIDSLVTSYGFKDRDSLIKFGIAVLLEGNNNEGIYSIQTNSEGGKKLIQIRPPAEMLLPKDQNNG